MSNWDGGIRGNAFVSGGFLPPAVRGTKFEGLVAVWDWYSTFCAVVCANDAFISACFCASLTCLSSL